MTPAESADDLRCGIYPALAEPPSQMRRTWLVVVAVGLAAAAALPFVVC